MHQAALAEACGCTLINEQILELVVKVCSWYHRLCYINIYIRLHHIILTYTTSHYIALLLLAEVCGRSSV